MIELRDLQFAYTSSGFGLRVKALAIAQGERVCWIGASGSGKTTLLHLVAGIFSPEAGRVTTCGVELNALGEAARRDFRVANVGLVFQDFALLDYLTVLENVLLPYRINRALRMDCRAGIRAEELAVSVGLGKMLSRRPAELSQGERQRVAVCRAIVARPKLVLADEPAANLDPASAAGVFDALEDYCTENNATLVVVSHDRDVSSRFDRVIDIAEVAAVPQPALAGGADHA